MLEFLAYLRQHVTSHLVFVSTGLSDEGKHLVEKYAHVIRRENIGYDFWSYKMGIDFMTRDRDRAWKRLLLINSSVVIANPALLVRRLFDRPIESGVLGLTFSEEKAPHIQSYCVMFEDERFIQSTVMRNWWDTMQPISDREQVIKVHEVGMSQYFLRQGVPVRALYRPTQGEKLKAIVRVAAERNIDFPVPDQQEYFAFDLRQSNVLNPTHYMWDSVLKGFGIVKIDFFLKIIFSTQFISYAENLPGWTSIEARKLVEDALV